MFSSNCCFLTCIQVSQEAGQVVWYFHLFQNFLQFVVIHTVKGFDIVNKAEIDAFLEFSCFFNDPADDTSKPTTGHCVALQREEIQFDQPEHRHKLPQPGKHHRTLTQPHPQEKTQQPRRTTILRTFFFPVLNHVVYSSYIFLLSHSAFCVAVPFSS